VRPCDSFPLLYGTKFMKFGPFTFGVTDNVNCAWCKYCVHRSKDDVGSCVGGGGGGGSGGGVCLGARYQRWIMFILCPAVRRHRPVTRSYCEFVQSLHNDMMHMPFHAHCTLHTAQPHPPSVLHTRFLHTPTQSIPSFICLSGAPFICWFTAAP
jgi:hypothetical protein